MLILNRIFFSNAVVTTPEFNNKLVVFEFVEEDKATIYKNKEMVLARINLRVLNRFLDNGVECQFFLRTSM